MDCICWAERLKADLSISSRHIPPNSNTCPPSIIRERCKQPSSLGGKDTVLPSVLSNIPKIGREIEIRTEKYRQCSCQDANTDQSWHRTDVSAVCGWNQTPTTYYTNHRRCKDETMWAWVCVFLCVSEAPTGSECAILAKQLLPFTQNTVSRLFQPDFPQTIALQDLYGEMVKRWHCMLNADDTKQRVTKSGRRRERWSDRSAAPMTPDVCRTIAHRENDEVVSKSVRVCVCSWVHMHMCVRLGQSMTMSICSPVSCAKSQECRQNIDTNVHGPIGLAQIYLVLLPWPTYSILSLHFIKFSCAKAITARKVCTKQNVATAFSRRVAETPHKLQLFYISAEMVQTWDYWDPLFWWPLHHFTLDKSALHKQGGVTCFT